MAEGSGFPSFGWRASATALGFPVGGHVTSTGENVFLSVYGDKYQLGSAPPPLPSIQPRRWFGHPRQTGEGEAGGADCARIQAPVRGDRAVGDLAPLLARFASPDSIEVRGTAEACVGFDDHLLHGLRVDAELAFPPQIGGATGAHVSADVTLSDIGEPQHIATPGGGEHYRPITDLLLTLQDLGVPVP
jgi:hypothetical protein